ncbi:outer membrane protein assembly factor BamD [Pelagibacterales bacterium SAG-MED17]|nr:outer membrane protein assembly factor BamD [Pelagibacterales bacterium SAG-MED17]
MKFLNFILFLLIINVLTSCSEKQEKVSLIKEDNLEMQMIEAYNEGLKEFNNGDIFFAAKKFNEVELLYPQSIWASRSTLMAAYSYYSQLYFTDAIIELERFLDKYKNHPNTDYAYYLLAICHYNQIVDEKKDLGEIVKAKQYFILLIKEYPNTDFAEDAKFKLELVEEILASKELYLANYYLEREKWIPAMNRYKKIVNEYNTTIFIEEALYRLVELNYKLGLIDEAKKYTALLGYNYQSSDWYERSYNILNTNYEKPSIKKDLNNQKSLLKKFKQLLQ